MGLNAGASAGASRANGYHCGVEACGTNVKQRSDLGVTWRLAGVRSSCTQEIMGSTTQEVKPSRYLNWRTVTGVTGVDI